MWYVSNVWPSHSGTKYPYFFYLVYIFMVDATILTNLTHFCYPGPNALELHPWTFTRIAYHSSIIISNQLMAPSKTYLACIKEDTNRMNPPKVAPSPHLKINNSLSTRVSMNQNFKIENFYGQHLANRHDLVFTWTEQPLRNSFMLPGKMVLFNSL